MSDFDNVRSTASVAKVTVIDSITGRRKEVTLTSGQTVAEFARQQGLDVNALTLRDASGNNTPYNGSAVLSDGYSLVITPRKASGSVAA